MIQAKIYKNYLPGKITSSGIVPHVLREILGYCCPKSKVTFGHHFVSMKDIEEHYSNDPEIDFSYPVYGKCIVARLIQHCFNVHLTSITFK